MNTDTPHILADQRTMADEDLRTDLDRLYQHMIDHRHISPTDLRNVVDVAITLIGGLSDGATEAVRMRAACTQIVDWIEEEMAVTVSAESFIGDSVVAALETAWQRARGEAAKKPRKR